MMNFSGAALLALWPPALETDSTWKDCEILHWALPHVCWPFVYLTSLHVTKSLRHPPSVFTYCKWSNIGSGNVLGARLLPSMAKLPEIDSTCFMFGTEVGCRLTVIRLLTIICVYCAVCVLCCMGSCLMEIQPIKGSRSP